MLNVCWNTEFNAKSEAFRYLFTYLFAFILLKLIIPYYMHEDNILMQYNVSFDVFRNGIFSDRKL